MAFAEHFGQNLSKDVDLYFPLLNQDIEIPEKSENFLLLRMAKLGAKWKKGDRCIDLSPSVTARQI